MPLQPRSNQKILPVNHNLLRVNIVNPDSTLYDGLAQSITSENLKGKFDILPSHARFITIIKNYITVKLNSTAQKQYHLNEGILRCYDNQVKIFIGL